MKMENSSNIFEAKERGHKKIEDDSELKDKKISELLRAKSDLEKVVESMENEIEFYRQAEIDLKEHRDQNEGGNDHGLNSRDPDYMI